MKRVAIVLNDSGFNGIDFNKVEFGNPGIGGTHFEAGLLLFYLSLKEDYIVFVFHVNNNFLPTRVIDKKCSTINEAIQSALMGDYDDVIIQNNLTQYALNLKTNTNIIVWAHNYPSPAELISFAKTKNIKKIVCVGNKVFRYCGFFTRKAVLIYNMISPSINVKPSHERDFSIAYLGSLTPGKSFDCLARIWPKLSHRFPNLKLYVIGSGKLYKKDTVLGKYGIASKEYEEKFVRYFEGNSNELDKNVIFCGDLGLEKYELINKCLLGIVNPTGKTETFGLTAVEFNKCGVYVVGSMPSIINGKNGIRLNQGKGLLRNIKKCLENPSITIKKGIESESFARYYYPDNIILLWESIL